jgi:hypothetical protein
MAAFRLDWRRKTLGAVPIGRSIDMPQASWIAFSHHMKNLMKQALLEPTEVKGKYFKVNGLNHSAMDAPYINHHHHVS